MDGIVVTGGREMARRLHWIKEILFSIVVIVLILTSVDLLVRVINPRPTYAPPRFEPRGVPFTRIEHGPLIYQPNTEFSSVYDPAGDSRGYLGKDGRVTYRINSLGCRG